MKANYYYFADGILENPETSQNGVSEYKDGGFLKVFECKNESELEKCINAVLLLRGFRRLDVYKLSDELVNDSEFIKDGVFGRFSMDELIEWNDLTLVNQLVGNEDELEYELIEQI